MTDNGELTGAERRDLALERHRKDPTLAALSHGVWPFVKARVLRCKKCVLPKIFGKECPEYQEDGECAYLERRGSALRDQIMALPQVQAQDAELVADYVYHCQLLELIQAVMAGLGPFKITKDKVALEPLLGGSYIAWSRHRRQIAEALGIGPAARAKLGAGEKGSSLVRAIIAVEQEEQADD